MKIAITEMGYVGLSNDILPLLNEVVVLDIIDEKSELILSKLFIYMKTSSNL